MSPRLPSLGKTLSIALVAGLAIGAAGCGTSKASGKDQDEDVATFEKELGDHTEVARIENVTVQPHGDSATYVIAYKASSVRHVVEAAYPGPLVKELHDAALAVVILKAAP